MFRGAPCADNSNPIFLAFAHINMDDNQQLQPTHNACRVPTLFAFDNAIRKNKVEWIIPNLFGERERNAVLGNIASRLCIIPLKIHSPLSY